MVGKWWGNGGKTSDGIAYLRELMHMMAISDMQIIEIIKSLTDKTYQPITVLWITHRLEELIYADKASKMINGKFSVWQNPNNFKEK